MEIIDKLLTVNRYTRPGTRRSKTTAIAVHYVANPGTSAIANRNYFENCRLTKKSVSGHYIIGLNGEIIRCIPDEEISYCTNQANSYTVSIECCHPDWTGKFNDKTYKSLVELCAEIIKKYNLKPDAVIRHFDVTGKVCPKGFVPKKNGGTDDNNSTAWNKFKADVVAKVTGSVTEQTTTVKSEPTSANVVDCDDFIVKVVTDTLNIRSGAGTNNAIVGTIKKNEKYTITHTMFVGSSEWGKLKSGAGWININKKYCVRVTEAEFKVKVICNTLNVRANAGTNNKITTTVKKNQIYTIVETKTVNGSEWGKLKSGAGWINLGSNYVKKV